MPTLKTLGLGLATAGALFTGIAFAEDTPDLKPGDDWATFEKFTTGKGICTTCHKLNEKSVGPSYQEVAAKRKEEAAKDKDGTVNMLAEKMIKGVNSGQVYGAGIMTPNPNLAEADAKKIAEWVLALDSGEAKAPAAEEAKPAETAPAKEAK